MRGVVEEARNWEPSAPHDQNPVASSTPRAALEPTTSPQPSDPAPAQSTEARLTGKPTRWKFVRIRGVEAE